MRTTSLSWRRAAATLAVAALAALGLSQGHVICMIASGADPAQIAADYGMTLLDTTAPSPFVLFDAPPGMTPEQMEAILRTDPRIIWAEDDGEVDSPESHGAGGGSTVAAVGDRGALFSRNLNLMRQISYVQMRTYDRIRVRVAILDNGISPLQPRLWNNVVASANFLPDGPNPWDLPNGVDTNGNGTPDEMLGHGTMVAGIIDLMAPYARLIVARVADSDGIATGWSLIEGIAFAVQNRAQLANISLGAIDEIPALGDVLEWAELNNLLIVAPIGNNGQRMALFPAHYGKALCVSGVLPTDVKAPFSNWLGEADAAAPATGILSTWWDGTMGIWSGTSFAAPLVTGALANSLPIRYPRSPDGLLQAVRNSGNNINSWNASYANQLGTRLNVRNLLRTLMR